MGVYKGYKQSKKHIEKRKRFGQQHHAWKGNNVSEKGGRTRALRLYKEIGACSICGNKKAERHHIDDDTANNNPENIEITCRKCHMALDGRLARFIKMAKRNKGIFGRMVAIESKIKNKHCPRGHLYSGVNANGARICRICMKVQKFNYLKRQKNTSIIETKTQTLL